MTDLEIVTAISTAPSDVSKSVKLESLRLFRILVFYGDKILSVEFPFNSKVSFILKGNIKITIGD